MYPANEATSKGDRRKGSSSPAIGIVTSTRPAISVDLGLQRSGVVRLSPCRKYPCRPDPPMMRWITRPPAPVSDFGIRYTTISPCA
jgi:hypothetical protein